MEQVVLHASDDAAESGDVAAEHAVEVHAPQFVRDADGRAQDLEEQAVVARMLAEFLVDQPQMARDLTDGRRRARRAPSEFCSSTTNTSSSADGKRVEHVLARDLEIIVADLEARH